MLSWAPVTTYHMRFIFKAEKLFPLLNSLTLTTLGTGLDALFLVTCKRWCDHVALSRVLLTDSTSCNILSRKFLPWWCGH